MRVHAPAGPVHTANLQVVGMERAGIEGKAFSAKQVVDARELSKRAQRRPLVKGLERVDATIPRIGYESHREPLGREGEPDRLPDRGARGYWFSGLHRGVRRIGDVIEEADRHEIDG